MSSYLRPRAPAATIFFAVTLAGRGLDLLVRESDKLRQAVAAGLAFPPLSAYRQPVKQAASVWGMRACRVGTSGPDCFLNPRAERLTHPKDRRRQPHGQ